MEGFFLCLLPLNCIFLFFFKKWLGPFGIFVSSLSVLLMVWFFSFISFIQTGFSGIFMYVDFGKWFFLLDIVDSNFIFILDNLTYILLLVVVMLSIFAQFFGSEYMYREAFITRLLYLLNMFITSVVFLFTVFDYFLILIVWELIGLFSLLLVNYYATRVYTLKAALKTFILSRASDLFIFFSFILIILNYNSTDLSILFFKTPFLLLHTIYLFNAGVNLVTILSLLIVLAGSVKAAQFIVHTWLPDAMEAPTPASALIHSSTLVIMGIYLILRCGLVFELSSSISVLMSVWGGFTISFGALSASMQNDIKKLVAYSTISQMGYLLCGCGFLCFNEVIVYLSMHAFNKAFLFVFVGYIVHFFSGNTDMRFMGSFYVYSVDVFIFLIIVSLNLSGLPYTSGFIAKEFILFQTFRDGFLILAVRAFWFVSFIFTPVYMILLNLYVFFYSSASTSLNSSQLSFVASSFRRSGWMVWRFNQDFVLVFSKSSALLFLCLFFSFNLLGEVLLLSVFNINNLIGLTDLSTVFILAPSFFDSIILFSRSLSASVFIIILAASASSISLMHRSVL